MSLAKFKVAGGRFEHASQEQGATITIDRERGLMHVRPSYGRRVYTVPLVTVAEWVVRTTIVSEVRNGK